MSAVLNGPALDDAQQRSEGVWHAAWRRFRADRVGLVSMWVVFAFLLLILLSSLGLVAKHWQDEVGVANAPPTFMGPAPPEVVRAASEYRPLFTYLDRRFADIVVLTFGQIEDLIGFALPAVARSQPDWWTRSEPDQLSVQADAWTAAHRTAEPNLGARTVTFARA